MIETPKVPVSIGELLDKITILEIKRERIEDEQKKKEVEKELFTLDVITKNLEIFNKFPEVSKIVDKLRQVNSNLWILEDRIRLKGNNGHYNLEFIGLARSIYLENDKRFKLKQEINSKTKSCFNEVKSHL